MDQPEVKYFIEDSFGLQQPMTPASEASNFTFNPHHSSPLFLSPLACPSTDKPRRCWDPRQSLFELEEFPSIRQLPEDQRASHEESPFDESEGKTTKVKCQQSMIAKQPKPSKLIRRVKRRKRKGEDKSTQLKLDIFLKAGPLSREQS